jgi:hypothetical protein
MLLTLTIFPLLQAQSARLKAQIGEWFGVASAYASSRLTPKAEAYYQNDRRYKQIEQKLAGVKDWYEQTKSAAQNSGKIPLEQKQTEATDRFAQAGAIIARQEAVIKQQLKDLWHSINNR